MRIEARNAIIIGSALIAFGLIALAWEHRDQTKTFTSSAFQFGRSRREEMIAEEFAEPE